MLYKKIQDGYCTAVLGSELTLPAEYEPISEKEYQTILQTIQTKPEGDYRLSASLEWVEGKSEEAQSEVKE